MQANASSSWRGCFESLASGDSVAGAIRAGDRPSWQFLVCQHQSNRITVVVITGAGATTICSTSGAK